MANLNHFNKITNQWEVIKVDTLGGVIPNNQTWTVAQGQTTFIIANGQIEDSKLLSVYVDGKIRTDVVMTNNTTFQFLTGLNSGQAVYAEWFEVSVPATIGHHSTHELNGQDPIDVTKLTNYQGQIATPITNLQTASTDHGNRISTIEGENLNTRVGSLETSRTSDETRLTNLENNTVTYITPTLLNGWVANDSVNYPPRYWKDKDGIVHYEFGIKNGATVANTVVMQFPVGYRPLNAVMCMGFCDDSQFVIYWINPGAAGELKFLRSLGAGYTAGGLMVLNGSFKAEA